MPSVRRRAFAPSACRLAVHEGDRHGNPTCQAPGGARLSAGRDLHPHPFRSDAFCGQCFQQARLLEVQP